MIQKKIQLFDADSWSQADMSLTDDSRTSLPINEQMLPFSFYYYKAGMIEWEVSTSLPNCTHMCRGLVIFWDCHFVKWARWYMMVPQYLTINPLLFPIHIEHWPYQQSLLYDVFKWTWLAHLYSRLKKLEFLGSVRFSSFCLNSFFSAKSFWMPEKTPLSRNIENNKVMTSPVACWIRTLTNGREVCIQVIKDLAVVALTASSHNPLNPQTPKKHKV